MRMLLAMLMLLGSSQAFAKGFEAIEGIESKEAINEAIYKHYQGLSLNEQWGVGMSCTVGAMWRLVNEATSMQIDRTSGVLIAETGQVDPKNEKSVHRRMTITYQVGSENITKVSITSTFYDGRSDTCSTRDPLIQF